MLHAKLSSSVCWRRLCCGTAIPEPGKPLGDIQESSRSAGAGREALPDRGSAQPSLLFLFPFEASRSSGCSLGRVWEREGGPGWAAHTSLDPPPQPLSAPIPGLFLTLGFTLEPPHFSCRFQPIRIVLFFFFQAFSPPKFPRIEGNRIRGLDSFLAQTISFILTQAQICSLQSKVKSPAAKGSFQELCGVRMEEQPRVLPWHSGAATPEPEVALLAPGLARGAPRGRAQARVTLPGTEMRNQLMGRAGVPPWAMSLCPRAASG